MSTRALGPTATSPWILDRWRDLVLIVGTPLLIIPTVFVARDAWSSQQVFLLVMSFGAVGHHLPGMMRAYGDRALFSRFRGRFIIAPIFLVAACVAGTLSESALVPLVAVTWGVWHGLMQVHGFARIYDAKVKAFDAVTARLDHLTVLTWFLAALAFSPARLNTVLDYWYSLGGPLVSASVIEGGQAALIALTAVCTVLYVGNAVRTFTRGRPHNPVKHALIVTSISFFWFAHVAIEDALLAVVLFEIFHDVQYLTIVWMFNRRRVDTDQGVGSFTRFLFRRSPALILLYVGLVFAYGGINYANETVMSGTTNKVLLGLLAASGLLHFYYDGFIWKVREKGTRQALGLEGGTAGVGGAGWGLPAWACHGAKWAVFVVPLFAMTALATPPSEDARRLMLAQSLPDVAELQGNRAVVLYQQGDLEGAAEAYGRALELDGTDENFQRDLSRTLFKLALSDLQAGDEARATERLRRAHELDPELVDRTYRVGVGLGEEGQHDPEALRYRACLIMDPSHAAAAFNLALTELQLGHRDATVSALERAEALMPEDHRVAEVRRVLREMGWAR